jgi:hypothetical protein
MPGRNPILRPNLVRVRHPAGERDSDEQASVLAAGATLAREPP